MARIIVFGNEKGGAGKSTLAMHVAVGLLHQGKTLGILDLDLRQVSLQRFFENRAAYFSNRNQTVATPQFAAIDTKAEHPNAEFARAIGELDDNDYILIDCPGALTDYARLAHAAADKLVTPLNDSFIDFDLLGRVDGETGRVVKPSIYAEMVWDARKDRLLNGGTPIDWIVARNRLSSLQMHNKRRVGEALENLSQRIGFRLIPGLSDRVIFKELFPQGLTLWDKDLTDSIPMKMSNVAARQELRDLIKDLELET